MTQILNEHFQTIKDYLEHGWKLIPIPYGEKGPTTPNWNQRGHWLQSVDYLPERFNVGAGLAWMHLMTFDIDQWDKTVLWCKEHKVDLYTLIYAKDAVLIYSGNPGHAKLLFRLPPGVTLPTVKVTDDDGKSICELRNGNSSGTTVQDVIPPSMHPNGTQYEWRGAGHWSNPPPAPPELIEVWSELLEQKAGPDRTAPGASPISTDLAEVQSALEAIPADIDREAWVRVGMAVHQVSSALDRTEEGYRLWDEWSQGTPEHPATKYAGPRDTSIVWRSFKPKADGIGPGTLFDIAREHGWTRPRPDVLAMFQTDPHQDSEIIDAVMRMRPARPQFDPDVFPPVLARFAKLIAKGVGCDPLIPCFSGLTAVSAVADIRSRLKLRDGYKVPPIAWTKCIAPPAGKKTPGSGPLFRTLIELEREDRPRFKLAKAKWDIQEAMHKREHKAFIEQQSNPLAGQGGVDFADAPLDIGTPPVPLLLTVSDITSQKLLMHCDLRPKGLCAVMDEMNGFLKNLTDPRSTDNRSTWVAAYEGNAAKKDTVSSGTQHVDPFGVAIYGNVQPEAWRKYLPLLGVDGFIQRFILGIVRPYASEIGDDQVPIDDSPERRAYDLMIRHIHTLPTTEYTLSPAAYRLFRKYEEWKFDLERNSPQGLEDETTALATYTAHSLGKSEGTVGRLALLFHLMIDPDNPVVGTEPMERAVKFMTGYVLPAQQYAYSELAMTSEQSFDQWLTIYLLSICADVTEVSMRDLKHAGTNRLRSYAPHQREIMISDAMTTLEAYKWVKTVDYDAPLAKTTWMVNPGLAERFADYRKQAIIVRQKAIEVTHRNIERTTGVKPEERTIPGFDPRWLKD